MNNLLDKFLKRLGVLNYESLSEDEKATFREWEKALQGRQLTDKDVRDFLEREYSFAVSRLTEVDLKPEDAVFRKVEVRFISKIMTFLNMPAMEKQLLEKQIESKL